MTLEQAVPTSTSIRAMEQNLGFRELRDLRLTMMGMSMEILTNYKLPFLTSLTVTNGCTCTDLDFATLPSLQNLVLLKCDFEDEAEVLWGNLKALVMLQLRDCRGMTSVMLHEMPQIQKVVIDAPGEDAYHWPEVTVSHIVKEATQLKYLFLRSVELDIEFVETWTGLQQVELMDCGYDCAIQDLYQVIVAGSPDCTCTVGYTLGRNKRLDPDTVQLYRAVDTLMFMHRTLQLDDLELQLVKGSVAFDGVEGVRVKLIT